MNDKTHLIAISILLLILGCSDVENKHSQAPIKVHASKQWELIWQDEFDHINTDNWNFQQGGSGWGNNELQYYTDGDNTSIDFDDSINSHVLTIEARPTNDEQFECWYGDCLYTSTRMTTQDKHEFKYGRIEARIKLPQTQGIWPAFWMLGHDFPDTNWPQCGEIDIMEHVGYEPNTTHGALHGPGYAGNLPFTHKIDLGESVDINYHVYAIEWTDKSIHWFVDDILFFSMTKNAVEKRGEWVYDQPFFILLNLAVGGNWPKKPDTTSQFPQQMLVDYIRVYR